MDLPSRQSLERSSRSPSSVRLAAISTRSHRTVLRGRDETAGNSRFEAMSDEPQYRQQPPPCHRARESRRCRQPPTLAQVQPQSPAQCVVVNRPAGSIRNHKFTDFILRQAKSSRPSLRSCAVRLSAQISACRPHAFAAPRLAFRFTQSMERQPKQTWAVERGGIPPAISGGRLRSYFQITRRETSLQLSLSHAVRLPALLRPMCGTLQTRQLSPPE